MTVLIVIGVIVVGVIWCIAEEGSFLSRLALSALVAAIAFLLLRWVTGLEWMTTLAKIAGATTILATLANIIKRIAD